MSCFYDTGTKIPRSDHIFQSCCRTNPSDSAVPVLHCVSEKLFPIQHSRLPPGSRIFINKTGCQNSVICPKRSRSSPNIRAVFLFPFISVRSASPETVCTEAGSILSPGPSLQIKYTHLRILLRQFMYKLKAFLRT